LAASVLVLVFKQTLPHSVLQQGFSRLNVATSKVQLQP